MDYAAIWAEAEEAAEKAMRDLTARYPTSRQTDGIYDDGACGFAWITIRPARGPFITWCKKQNAEETKRKSAEHGRTFPCHPKGDNHWKSGWQLWQPGSSKYRGQSVATYEAAANAFADVLTHHGIANTVGSRLD